MSEYRARQTYKHGLLTSIAREAGVSVATVSKVLHGRPDVGRATRSRIEALLEAAGTVRGTPETAPARRFYAVFRDLDSPYTLEVVRGIVDAGGRAGLQVVVGTTMHRPIAQWLDACAEPGVLGMVLVISMMAEHDQQRVLSKHVPVVLIDPLSQPLPGVPCVGVTDWRGAYDAVGHLLQLGHRRIGIVAGRPHSPAGGARLHGYRAALHNAGIDYDADLVRSTDFDYSESVTATTELLTLPERPTAVFATSDAQALGTLEAARALRISVPQDLSVVSFDDTSAAATASPPLTAVRQPYDELGQIAAGLLIDMSNGKTPVVDRFELATALTLRSSTTALIAP
jgi:DNA-binding LacI/PurR family transcriptional regulator